jgi:D-glycero-beta-D-manno-heptose-7-phosphate kinase
VEVARCTTEKTRVVARSQQLVRVDEEDESDLTGSDVGRVIDAVDRAVEAAHAVVIEDYNKGVLVPQVIQHVVELATRRGVPLVVDPKYRNFFLYRGATLLKPNRRELEAALGAGVDLEHPAGFARAFERLGVENLLLTLGEQGMALLSAGGEAARIPTAAREVYDVVGAGDTVTAYLATMLAAGATPREAAYTANLAAGIEVGKLGAATVSGEEVLEYERTHGTTT